MSGLITSSSTQKIQQILTITADKTNPAEEEDKKSAQKSESSSQENLPQVRGLSSEEREFYTTNGYVIVKGVFSKEEVKKLKEASDSLVSEVKQLPIERNDVDISINYKGSVAVLRRDSDSKEPIIQRVVWAAGANDTFLTASRDPRLTNLVRSVLADGKQENAHHLIASFHPKNTAKTEFGVHQDSQNRALFQGRKGWQDGGGENLVQSFIGIDPWTEKNGGVYAYPGSHRLGWLHFTKQYTDMEEFDKALKQNGKTREDLGSAVLVELEEGDVLLVHPHLVHFSKPNQGEARRDVLISGFTKVGANSAHYPGFGATAGPGSGSGVEISLTTGKPLIRKRVEASNETIHNALKELNIFTHALIPGLEPLSKQWAKKLSQEDYQTALGGVLSPGLLNTPKSDFPDAEEDAPEGPTPSAPGPATQRS